MNPQKIVSAKMNDPKVWEDFKELCDAKGVKMSYELEIILKEYVKNNKK